MLQRKNGQYTQKIKILVYMYAIFKPAYTEQAFEGKMRDPDQRICVSYGENIFKIHKAAHNAAHNTAHKAAAKTPKIHCQVVSFIEGIDGRV